MGEPTLAAFVASSAGIPQEEAEEIARRIELEWEERQSTVEVARERRLTNIGVGGFTVVVGLAVLGLVLGVAALIWLVVSAL
jgi:uncharacterized membrane protein